MGTLIPAALAASNFSVLLRGLFVPVVCHICTFFLPSKIVNNDTVTA